MSETDTEGHSEGSSSFAPISNRSYLVKMTAGVLLVTVAVGAIGFVTVQQTGAVLSQDTQAQFQTNAQLQSGQAAAWFNEIDQNTQRLAAAPVLQTGDTEQIGQYVNGQYPRQVPSTVSAIHYVELTGDEARVLNSTYDGLSETTLGSEVPWASLTTDQIGEARSFNSDVYQSPAVTGNAMAFVTPIGDSDRALVVVTNLNKASGRLQPPQEGRAIAVRGDTVLMATDPSLIGSSVTEQGFLTDSELQAIDQRTVPNVGEAYFGTETSYRDSPQVIGAGKFQYGQQSIIVFSQAPQSAVFSLQNQVQQSVLLLAGVVLALVVLVFGTLGYTTVRDLRSLSSKAEQVADGDFDTPLDTDRGDEVGQAFESVDSMRDSLQQRIDEAERAATLARQAQQEQRELNDQLTDAVESYAEQIDTAADGYLAVRLDESTDVEQLNVLARRFNDMLSDLQTSIERTKAFSDEVSRASEDARVVMNDISQASGDIARAMQSISDAATDQSQQLEGTLDEVNDLAATTEELASTADQVAVSADRTAETCREEIESARAVVQNMQAVDEQAESTAGRVDALLDRMDEIDEISDFIEDVARQTNMLALNANIEASRAAGEGDDGGFEVVAEEITDLADQIQDSVGEIDDLIQETQAETRDTAESVQETRNLVGESTSRVNETIEALEEITDFANETNTGVQQINQAAQDQASSTQEVTAMVEDANDVSERTASDAESVAAAAEEQTASVSEVDEDIRSLAEQAAALDDALEQFTLDADAVDGTGSSAPADD